MKKVSLLYKNRLFTTAFVLAVIVNVLAFARMEAIAHQATQEACNAFEHTKQMLKNTLELAIPEVVYIPHEAKPIVKQKLRIEQRQRFALKDKLIEDIDEESC